MKYCIIENGYDWPAFVYDNAHVLRRWGYYDFLFKYYQKIQIFYSIEVAENYAQNMRSSFQAEYTIVPLDVVQQFIAEEKLKET